MGPKDVVEEGGSVASRAFFSVGVVQCRSSLHIDNIDNRRIAVYPADSGGALPIAWRGGGQLGHELIGFP